jgi:hypothetical protein
MSDESLRTFNLIYIKSRCFLITIESARNVLYPIKGNINMMREHKVPINVARSHISRTIVKYRFCLLEPSLVHFWSQKYAQLP